MRKLQVEKTASAGIAAAPAHCCASLDLRPETGQAEEGKAALETEKFEAARIKAIKELEKMAEENQIFAAHREIAGDIVLKERVLTKIREEKRNAQEALAGAIGEFAAVFDSMDDTYMKERVSDVRDVGRRMMACLKDAALPEAGSEGREMIVVAKELYPSDMVKMNPEYVKGILMEEGGITSHVSLMAKSMGIPILVGVKGILEAVRENDMVCMDADAGEIVIDPDESTQKEYAARKERHEKRQEGRMEDREKPLLTKNGRRVFLCANAGNLEDINRALSMGAHGIGLFRSEYLYMESDHFPTEEEQFAVYREAAGLASRELTIRTLDIGGDKKLSYFPMEKEKNPFLGWRGIRISLERTDIFKTQLRAILRAGAFGHVRILFPMMTSTEEWRAAKEILEECKRGLREEKAVFDESVETGVMIETPAAVLLAEEFAKEADFFSIGTNDLIQYLLAVDRGNAKVTGQYDFMHPAVLRAVRYVTESGHRAGISVGMCGEMAESDRAVPKLLEMGLDEFSVSPGRINRVRGIILEEMGETWKNE